MEKLNIQTERITIRHLVETDLEDFHLYRSNPEITKYQGFDVMTLQEAKLFINVNAAKIFGKAGEWVQYAIENNETGKLIGDCAIKLQEYDTRIAEIGITISHLHQQNGFAKETLVRILKFLFEEKGVDRVVETVDVENTASIKLLESTGFKKEGHFVENIFFKGHWGSEYQYAMLQREWNKDKISKTN